MEKRLFERCYRFAWVKQLDFLPNFHCCTSTRDTWYLKFLDQSYSCNWADGASIQLPRQFYMKFVRNTWRRDPPYPSSNSRHLYVESLTLGTFISPVLMRHTVPQPPNVDLGRDMTPQFKTRENPATSALHCNSFEGFHMFIFGHLPIGNQWRLKRFCFKKWVSSTQDQPQFNHLLAIPEKRSHPKCFDKQLLDGQTPAKGGGIGMMYLMDVPKMPLIYRISSIWNWLDRFLWHAKVENPQKKCI